jgi:hypothetical protein
VPDVPSHGIIPLSPILALVQCAPDGVIIERNVAEINRAMRATSRDYFFARDFASCPFYYAGVDAALRAFELSGSPVVLIDRSGKVLRVNVPAEKVLRFRDLRIVGRKIVSWDRSATAALDRALHALIWRKEASLHTPVILPRHQGRPISNRAQQMHRGQWRREGERQGAAWWQ